MKKNRIKQAIRYGVTLIAGVALGVLLIPRQPHQPAAGESEKQVWTCSMHPQIKMDKPGKCPICGMDLIPLKPSGTGDAAINADAIQLSKEAVALANIQTTKVSRRNPVKEVRLYGTIQPDERLLQSQTSHVSGRIEKLVTNFTGESVRRGQTIALIYSPELLSAQQELLEAAKAQSLRPALLQAAREKLRLWKLTDEQIAQIEQSGSASPLVGIHANTGGIIVAKKVSLGDYVSPGSVLFDIADLSRVWAVFDAYEQDLPFLKVGDRLEYTLQALPGRTFSGKISFINPIIDPTTRTAKVRMETSNPDMRLKPEMYADAIVKAPLQQYNNKLVIPRSAVLWTGKRSIVYVKQPDTETPAFMLRQIELGPSLGQAYVVLSGLEDGEEIVTNGAFTIDAGAQLEGKRSMMNEEASHPATGHAMMTVQGNCDMCKARIESAAKAVNGVTSAVWDKKSKQLHIDFRPEETSGEQIGKAVAKSGHDTDKHKADQATYDALPGCCRYRS
jgi:Cu(I)/Ag(I) efflux system membrane fusion protein